MPRHPCSASALVKEAVPGRASSERGAHCLSSWIAKTCAFFDYTIFFPIPSHPLPTRRLYEGISCPLIPVDMAHGQAKSKIKNNGRQPPVLKDQVKYSGFVYQESELVICREAASRHQRTNKPFAKAHACKR